MERWYYDACALEHSKSAYAEMFGPSPIQPIISHLAFGEAYANSHLKGPEQVDAFVKLMRSLSKFITVIQNDGCEEVLRRVQEEFPRLSITDAIHLATAVFNNCVVIRTSDRDLCGQPRTKLNAFGEEFGLSHLTIKCME